MSTAVAFTKEDLDQVFDEVKNAQADFDNKRGALQDAEQKARAVKGLTAAAQHALRNAEERLQLLKLAQDEAKSKNADYTDIVKQLAAIDAELTRANDRRTAVGQARTAISEIKSALQEWLSKAQQATTKAFEDTDKEVSQLSIAAAKKDTMAASLRKRGDMLNKQLELAKPQEQQLNLADQQLQESAPSAERISELENEKARLVAQRDRVKPKSDKAPTSGDIQKAEDDIEAAKTAAEEAPEVERDRQAKLTLARRNLAAAEDRKTAALVAKDEAERSWIGDIDLIGPGADGLVTAKATLASTPLPLGYSLEWTFDGVPAAPDSEGDMHFDTKGLAAGSYAIAVHLHRD